MNRLHNPHTAPTLPNRFANARALAARPDLVTTYWRVVGPSSRPLACALYRTATGLKVRIGYEPDEWLRAQRVASEETGATVAAIWKKATMSLGSFLDLSAPM